MKRKKIFEALFWIALIVAIVLILWRILGNSPSDLSIIITLFLVLMFKIWAISDETKEFKHEVKLSFAKVKKDFEDLKSNLEKKKIWKIYKKI